MAIVVKNTQLGEILGHSERKLWAYCGLDVLLTHELLGRLKSKLKPETTARTYNFELACYGPALAMMRRGMKIDEEAKHAALFGNPEGKDYKEKAGLYHRHYKLAGIERSDKKSGPKWIVTNENAVFQRYAKTLMGETFSPSSRHKLIKLLYNSLGIPPVYKRSKTGNSSISTDHETLEKLAHTYPRAEPIIKCLFAIRELEKQINVLEGGIDYDGRIRCSFNVGGTETGRWSSSTSVWDTGTNLQNITPELRRVFTADPGYEFAYIDLEQAESRAVAYLSGDESYIKACESGDLHTTVASMVFGVADREEADRNYYRHFSYRDMAKRAGHGTNYGLTPVSLARHMKVTNKIAWRFHLLYLGGELPMDRAEKLELMDLKHDREGRLLRFPGAFPGIRAWHDEIADAIESTGVLVTPFARERTFWGRPSDGSTLRKAIAYGPQSAVGDLLNLGMWRVWYYLEGELPVQLLLQVHDAIGIQYPKEARKEVLDACLEMMTIPVPVNGRVMTIPSEAKYGPNWNDLEKYEG